MARRSNEENSKIISEILRPHPEEILEIVQELRVMIKESFPDWEERGYPVWKAIGFRDPIQGYVCGLFPFLDRVDLVFEWGVLLKDPKKKLLGQGKQIRYLRYHSRSEIVSKLILDFLKKSILLPRGKKDKEFLIHNLPKKTRIDRVKRKA